MEECAFFSRIVNALSGLSAEMRRELGTRIETMDAAESTRMIIEIFGVGAKNCPHCGVSERHRHGTSCGLRRYRCLGCARTDNALSGTPLARLKHRNVRIKYTFALITQMTVRDAAVYCNIAKNTALHWRHRFTEGLARSIPDGLSGIIEADETFFRENQKGARILNRPALKRGTPAVRAGEKRRLSAVLIARDRSRATIVQHLETYSEEAIHKVMKTIVAPDALLCTDGFGYYTTLARKRGVTHVQLIANRQERVRDGAFHIQNVNAFTSNLKTWMRKFRGVATKHLQKYLQWRCFVDAHPGVEMAEKLLQTVLTPRPTAI